MVPRSIIITEELYEVLVDSILEDIMNGVTLNEGALSALATKFVKGAHQFIIDSTKKLLPTVYEHIKAEHPDVNFEKQAFIEAGESIVKKMNPKEIYHEMKDMIKKHGWKLGVVAAFVELFEHFAMPAIVAYLGYPKLAVVTGTLPIGELIFYPITFKLLGSLEKMKDQVFAEEFFSAIDPYVLQLTD